MKATDFLLGLTVAVVNAFRGYERVGFWRAGEMPSMDETLPWPEPYLWGPTKRDVLVYVRAAPVVQAYFGEHRCRLCGVACGNTEKSDGVFVWPEGLAHYLVRHDVKLPQHFIDHVLAQRRGKTP
jgi:hypothetical protein